MGLFSDAATWAIVDATSKLDSEAGSTAVTTGYVESSAFTPGTVTLDAIAVKVATRASVPLGTISVRLAQGGGLVVGTEVTIDIQDIRSGDGEQGWYLFKFAAPVVLAAATAYTVSVKTSNAAMVSLFRDGTAANWSRMLRTTSTSVPTTGSDVHILGEWTASGTKTDRSVTMDLTTTLDLGPNDTTKPPAVTIGNGGTLIYGTAAATNYTIRLSTSLAVYRGGQLTIGQTGADIAIGATAVLEFNCTADGDFGLIVFGGWTQKGNPRTAGKNVVQCLMSADKAAGQTILTVDADTGWLSGDEIGIGSTTRTATQAEERTLASDATTTTVTATAGLTNAHGGVAPIQAEVVLLTRNVIVRSVSTTAMAFVRYGTDAVVNVQWTMFRYLGDSTTLKRGVEGQTVAGSASFAYCLARDFDNGGFYVSGSACNNFAFSQCSTWNTAGGANQAGFFLDANGGTGWGSNWSLANCTAVKVTGAGSYGFKFEVTNGTVQTIRASSSTAGVAIDATGQALGTFDGIDSHSHAGKGVVILGLDLGGRISNVNAWRNTGRGFVVTSCLGRLIVASGLWFGNTTANLSLAAVGISEIIFRSLTLASDTTFATALGVEFTSAADYPWIVLENCTLGQTTGIYDDHTSADIDFANVLTTRFVLRKTLLASATAILNQSTLQGDSCIAYQRVNQATNVHKTVYPQLGTVEYDTAVFRTATPSEKLSPSSAPTGCRLRSAVRQIPIQSSKTAAVTVYVRKSAGYSGSAPRLVLLANAAIGFSDDVVAAIHSAPPDTWQALSYTTPAAGEDGVASFVLEVDGAAGAVYTDDWAAS